MRPIFRVLMVYCLISGIRILGQPPFVTNGLVAYYPFNGSVADQSGNGFGLANFGATFAPDRFGTTNRAISITNGATLTTSIPIPLTSNRDRTIALWVLPQAKTALPYGRLLGWGGGPLGFTSLYFKSYRPNPFALDAGGAILSINPGFNPTGYWTHIAWSYSTNLGGSAFYVNGVRRVFSFESGAPTNQLATPLSPLILGDIPLIQYPVAASFAGELDDVRIYNRALTDAEVKGLFNYESIPQPQPVHQATATAQLDNGFLVNILISDGGYGYTNVPNVTIVGGGGHGATALASISNEVVISISPDNAGKGYTSMPTIVIDPPPYPPTQATATALLTNDSVLAVVIADGGHGYGSTPPPVTFIGNGSGASGVAVVTNGVVSSINLTNPGGGYTTAPSVVIGSPESPASLSVAVSQVRITLSLAPGYRYQLQSSSDGIHWTNSGGAFIADSAVSTQVFDVEDQVQLFRVILVP